MKKTSVEELYGIYLQHPVISKDSRNIPDGCIYFALKGESFDGNEFAQEAIEKGAAYAVIDDPEKKQNDRFLLVEDCLQSLQNLAKHHRSKLNIPLIGLTGSNGKTTTKELIAQVLKKKFKVLATQGNLNNHIGVPLTLLQIRPEHEIAIIEMGANHQGEIDFLSHIAQPDFGLITNIGKAHLEGFGGIEGVKKGKSELYKYLEKSNGNIFLNSDDPILVELCPPLTTYTYGTNNNPFCKGELLDAQMHIEGSWHCGGQQGIIFSSLFGAYNFYNILAAVCIGNHFKVVAKDIDTAIREYESNMNRSQIIQGDNYKVYLDAYNANPTSMKAAINNFKHSKAAKKTVILGDMFELGSESDLEHATLLKLVESSPEIDEAVLVGNHFMRQLKAHPKITFLETTMEAKEWFKQKDKEATLFLIKGSRGMALEKILE
jgi:UDP-N-acetylmuramoyl-tripeptide--D-alanyl-D-alanine ligase